MFFKIGVLKNFAKVTENISTNVIAVRSNRVVSVVVDWGEHGHIFIVFTPINHRSIELQRI